MTLFQLFTISCFKIYKMIENNNFGVLGASFEFEFFEDDLYDNDEYSFERSNPVIR